MHSFHCASEKGSSPRISLAIRGSLNHHLFWHAAYLGLSYLTNPYVSTLRDSAAVEYVQAIDPACDLWRRGIRGASAVASGRDRSHQDHKFIFYTLAAKAGVLACMLLLCINIGFAAAVLCPKPLGTELAFGLAMAVAAIPGIVAYPGASLCSRHDYVGSAVLVLQPQISISSDIQPKERHEQTWENGLGKHYRAHTLAKLALFILMMVRFTAWARAAIGQRCLTCTPATIQTSYITATLL